MPRTLRAASAMLLLVATLALAACGGGATPVPALTDPADILVAAVKSIQSAKTVHVAVELDGEIPLDLGDLLGTGGTGTGGAGGSFDVSGTTIDGDIDIANQSAKLTFSLPGLLNLQGEVIVVDGSAFVKVNLLGDKYHVFDNAGDVVPLPSAGPSGSPDTAKTEADLRQAISELSTPPVKLADEQCGDATCYHVQVKLEDTDTGPIASMAPGVTANGTLDVYVRQNDLRPSRIVVSGDASDAGQSGNLTATVTFSGWDAAVDIKAPPADQVTEDGFPLPSLGD